MKAEPETQALEGAAASDPKQEARELLQAGSSPEEVMEQTGLSKAVVLGLLGAQVKAKKKLDKGSPPGNQEEDLVNDLRDEAKLDGAALIAARNRNRLKREGPEIYGQLHGGQGQESEGSSSRVLVDLETAKLIRAMRQEEEQQHRNNGGEGTSATDNLRKEIDALREEMHKKDVEALKKETEKLAGEIGELRADLRHSTNSASDLSVVVREASGLLEKVVESNGPLRAYLLPDNVSIRPPGTAPPLAQAAVGNGTVLSELRSRGLVTKIVQR